MQRTVAHLAAQAGQALLLCLALAACGGGGGGGSPPPKNVAVTAANQDAVTRAAMAGASTGALGGSLGSIPTGGGQASPLALVHPALMRALSVGVSTAKRPAAVFPANGACTLSGSFSGSVNDRDGSLSLTVGDTVSLTFSDCIDVTGVVLNGSMSFTYTQLVQTPLTVAATVAASGLSVDETGTSYAASLSGGFAFTYTEPTGTTAQTVITVPDALALGVRTPTYSDTITLLDGYTTNSAYDSVAALTTVTAAGPVATRAGGGFVTVATPTPLVQLDSEDYPHAGVVVVTGLTGQVRATVQSSSAQSPTAVLMELDADGNNSFEASKTVAWASLF